MPSRRAWRHDQYHCRCYSIDEREIWSLRDKLRSLGFEKQIREDDHGQAWGLRYKTSEKEQIHIKAMPDGRIESEMEPQPEYPLAHLDQKHSYSPHRDLGLILRALSIRFQRVQNVPLTCRRRIINRPKNPINWKVMAAVAIAVSGIALAVAYKKSRGAG